MLESTPVADNGAPGHPDTPGHKPRWSTLWQSKTAVQVCLVLVLLLAAVFRLTGVNWDSQTHLHPDERFVWMVEMSLQLPKSIGEYFNTAVSPLNPYNRGNSFVYGTFPLFLTRWLGDALKLGDGEHIHLVGRVLAAIFDLVTVWLMFFIGRKLYDERVGLLASFLTACTVIQIQQAHFFTVDSFSATFIVLTFLLALRVAERGSWSDFLCMGVSYGLAAACKLNTATFGAIMVLACLLRIYNAWRTPVVSADGASRRPSSGFSWQMMIGGVSVALRVEPPATPASEPEPAPEAVAPPREPHWLEIGYGVAVKFFVCLVVAFFTFRIFQPYTFQGPGFFGLKFSERWLNDMRNSMHLMSGQADYFPSHQWASRPAVLFSLQNMVLWMMGIPLGLASWAGWALAGYQLLAKRKLQHLLILAWTTFYFLYQSTQFVKNSRYLIPVFPFFALLAAYLLISAWEWAKTARLRWARVAATAAVVVVAVGTFLWAFAFTRIYTRPLTRVAASLWIYDNIPPGSSITSEGWDDPLPWGGVGGRNGYAEGIYTGVEMQPYHEDLPEKLDWYVDWLTRADYVILSSNRLYGSIPRLPMRYPMTTRYYQYLFSGELGFELIKTFTSHPNLGPIEINDDNAEEAYTVYDHPKVSIFKKTEAFSPDKVRHLLGDGIDWDNIARLRPVEVPNWKNGLQLTDQEKEAQRAGGTWSAIFNRKSLSNALPVLFWLLLVEILGLVTLPLAYHIFHGLADRGYILAKTLGILLLTWITWMLVNLGLTGYSRTAIGAALLLMAAVAGLIAWRKRDELLAFVKDNQRLIVVNELLFLLFFGLFLAIRYGNPDLWHPVMGGEKPMDLAYLNAVIRSSTFPPYDPWSAGGYLNYYYYGQVIVATLIKFTGIVPWVGYNLAIPLLAALTAMGAFCVAYNLTRKAGSQSADSARPELAGAASRLWRGWWRKEYLWGLLAALMVVVLGNLDEISVLIRAVQDMGRVDAKSSIGFVRGLASFFSGLSLWISGKGRPGFRPEWPYWNPSRVMTHGEINEFPFFTFLYADLHAHLIALPFGLLALGLAVGIVRQKARAASARAVEVARVRAQGLAAWARSLWERYVARVDWGEVWLLSTVALVVGALRCINSWDYPTYMVVAGVALVVREYEQRGKVDLAGLWAVAWRSAALFVLSTLFFQPFHARFAMPYAAFERWKGPRTPLDAYLIIHGLFLFCIVSWLVLELLSRQSRGGVVRMLRLAGHYWDRLPRLLGLYRRLARQGREFDLLLGTVTAVLVLLLAWWVKAGEWFGIFLLLVILGTLLVVLHSVPPEAGLRWRMDPRRRFVWLLFGLGLVLSGAVDLVVLKGDIGRMNTVFKFYLQIWVFWSVAAAFALSEVAERLPRWSLPRRRLWLGALGVLLFLAVLYPVFAGKAKINDRFDASSGPSLDGMAYMKTSVYHDNQPYELKWDYDAINWLLDNVQGTPVIAEGNTEERGLYRWGSRISIYTGMPTILGWSWHQRQQRSAMPGEWIDRRLRDVTDLYRDSDVNTALNIIQKYDVRYIYVGELERDYYPGPGLDKFENMRAQGLLSLAYYNERVQIYEVIKK